MGLRLRHGLTLGAFLLCALAQAQVQSFAPAPAQCGPMDVVFVVDNTGTMGDVIFEVQSQVNAIADTVKKSSGGDYQFGLVVAPSNYINVLLDMSANNRDALATAVTKMTTEGSCGEPAAWDDGLDTVLHNLKSGRNVGGGNGTQIGDFNGKFRPAASKIIIIISDARPNHTIGCDFTPGADDKFVHGLAVEADALGIHLATVFVPTVGAVDYGYTAQVEAIMKDLADTSHGMYLKTQPDASDLASVILKIVESCGGGPSLVGVSYLTLDPHELVLSNGEKGTATVRNFRTDVNPATLVYTASGLTDDSTTRFTSVTPDSVGMDQRSMEITVGQDALPQPYVVQVNATDPASGTVDTAVMMVYVDCAPPLILSLPGHQPSGASVPAGSTASLKVIPSGTDAFRYQWYIGHTGATHFPISGATASTLTTPAISKATDFWVRVSNPCGSTDSATATVIPQ